MATFQLYWWRKTLDLCIISGTNMIQ
jgi:hypothetical protein